MVREEQGGSSAVLRKMQYLRNAALHSGCPALFRGPDFEYPDPVVGAGLHSAGIGGGSLLCLRIRAEPTRTP